MPAELSAFALQFEPSFSRLITHAGALPPRHATPFLDRGQKFLL
jgi:hypothetical protein